MVSSFQKAASSATEVVDLAFLRLHNESTTPLIATAPSCTAMDIIKGLNKRRVEWKLRRAENRLLSTFPDIADDIARSQWAESLTEPSKFYARCFHYFHQRLPEPVRLHRAYFETDNRGFGEKSFHVLWFLLFREFRPESFLEIGVFRGQTLSLAALLARHFKSDCFIQGISPFTAAGDSVSQYPSDVFFYEDTLANFRHFSLPAPALLKSFSNDAPAVEVIASREWSCIYIDGNHDYEIARQDWELCAAHLCCGGLLVLDDSGLNTDYVPPAFATAGHPGPSRLAQEIDRSAFVEILQVGHNRVFRKLSHGN